MSVNTSTTGAAGSGNQLLLRCPVLPEMFGCVQRWRSCAQRSGPQGGPVEAMSDSLHRSALLHRLRVGGKRGVPSRVHSRQSVALFRWSNALHCRPMLWRCPACQSRSNRSPAEPARRWSRLSESGLPPGVMAQSQERKAATGAVDTARSCVSPDVPVVSWGVRGPCRQPTSVTIWFRPPLSRAVSVLPRAVAATWPPAVALSPLLELPPHALNTTAIVINKTRFIVILRGEMLPSVLASCW